MKILKLWLDGYGCFQGREVELAPELQVIAGPNEQGKTTLRSFIADMLYGQKTSAVQRRYDDSNQLRLPWDSPEYGGRMLYRLDDGCEIEIHRNFDRDRESVRVYDRTNAHDITGEFPRMKNHEPAFAEMQLGLPKKAFLSAANIGFLNLAQLGDQEAMGEIRDKLLSLADSGDEKNSSEAVLKRLDARIKAIGQPAART